ncbi:MAG: hypothetical protein M3394_06455 [Actinomycetota bacterium]|nr:hypothetical protein [Actinomycetota bacterium]
MRRILLATLLLLAGCNGDDSPTVSAGDDTTTTSSTTTSSTTAGTSTSSTTPGVLFMMPPSGTARAYLKGVQVAAQGKVDRVVFEFEGALPGYEIALVERPVAEDGSGDEVRVEGAALLRVRLDNAAGARIEGERVVEVYTGPDRVRGSGTRVVVEAVDAGDFEGTVTWVIGLKAKAEVKVSTLESPHRLVVDVTA